MKIEFDENNPLLVSVVATMMNTLSNRNEVTVSIPDINPEQIKEAFLGDTSPIVDEDDFKMEKPEVGEEVDANGFTHDSRIHARTKTKNADGTWKILRRPQSFETAQEWEAFIAEVRAEQSGDLPPPVVEEIESEEVPPPNNFGAESEEVPPPVVEEDEPVDITFGVLMKTVTGSGGKVTPEDLQEICEGYELTSSVELSKPANRILLPAIYSEVMDIINA